MIFNRLFTRKTDNAQVLYEAIVAAARHPVFYSKWHVPDTVNGRFDMIVLHVHLVMERLRGQGPDAEAMRQKLVDTFFRDMDRSLREMGVGDLGVGKKVRKMSESFYGRILAYNKAGNDQEALVEVLKRNLFPDDATIEPTDFASWISASQEKLLSQSLSDILQSRFSFASFGVGQ